MDKANKKLLKAIKRKDPLAVMDALRAGANPNTKTTTGKTTLQAAFDSHAEDKLKIALIDAGADVAPVTGWIVWAAGCGNATVLKRFIDAGADMNLSTHAGRPLQVAARNGHCGAVEMLIQAGADVDAGTYIGNPLSDAAEAGHFTCANLLLQHGADPTIACKFRPILLLAAKAGDLNCVRLLLERGVNVEARGSIADRAYNKAVIERGIAEFLSMLGVPDDHSGIHVTSVPNSELANNYQNVTPLMVAAAEGHLEVVKALIGANADVHAVDDEGNTALTFAEQHPEVHAHLAQLGISDEKPPEPALCLAIESGSLEDVRNALQSGANVNTADSRSIANGQRPLMLAARRGDIAIVQMLLDAGAEVDAVEHCNSNMAKNLMTFFEMQGRTALLYAAKHDHADVVKILAKAGANLEKKDSNGETALSIAAQNGNLKALQMLITLGANLETRTSNGGTALVAAASEGQKDAANLLLSKGANPNAADREGVTALGCAVQFDDPDWADTLLKAGARADVTCAGTPILVDARETSPEMERLIQTALPDSYVPEIEEEDDPFANYVPKVTLEPGKYERDTVIQRLSKNDVILQAAIPKLETLCGSTAQKTNFGGVTIHVATQKELDIHSTQQAFQKQGVFVFAIETQPFGEPTCICALPTTDKLDAIAIFQTNGCNYDIMPAQVIQWMADLEVDHPYSLTKVTDDALGGFFLEEVADADGLAQKMYDFCPDVVDQNLPSTVEALATRLRTNQAFHLWWD